MGLESTGRSMAADLVAVLLSAEVAHCLRLKAQAEISDPACMSGARYHREPHKTEQRTNANGCTWSAGYAYAYGKPSVLGPIYICTN